MYSDTVNDQVRMYCSKTYTSGDQVRMYITLVRCTYIGPSILRPPMGPRKSGLILQVVLKKGNLTQKIALWDQIRWS